jgi:hypothetical protein
MVARAILEAMLDLQTLPREWLRPLKRTEYEQMVEAGLFVDEPIELLDGFLVFMTPIGDAHVELVDRLTELFILALHGRFRVRSQGPFALSDASEPEPDIGIYPLRDYSEGHPSEALLIIEVADSSLAKDRRIKGPLYAREGVLEYWIVDVVGQAIEVHTVPENGRYTKIMRHVRGETIAPLVFPEARVDIEKLFEKRFA